MSVAFTEQAVRDRTKTVTRRKGWEFAKAGDQITLCRKVMGRKKGEPLERIVDVELVSVRRERLDAITPQDVAREGFPDLTTHEFIEEFFVKAQGIEGHQEVTRIEWRYLDDGVGPSAASLPASLLTAGSVFTFDGESYTVDEDGVNTEWDITTWTTDRGEDFSLMADQPVEVPRIEGAPHQPGDLVNVLYYGKHGTSLAMRQTVLDARRDSGDRNWLVLTTIPSDSAHIDEPKRGAHWTLAHRDFVYKWEG